MDGRTGDEMTGEYSAWADDDIDIDASDDEVESEKDEKSSADVPPAREPKTPAPEAA